ncbi:MAG: RidA family protein [Thiohalocapsa sp.]
MEFLKHVPTTIPASFSDAIGITTSQGIWIFVSGQLGVPLPPEQGSVSFEQEVRAIFERIRAALGKLDAGMEHVVSIKAYLTDLAPYDVYSRVRAEMFPNNPPTSTAVQVAGLLRGAKIEVDAIAFLPRAAG